MPLDPSGNKASGCAAPSGEARRALPGEGVLNPNNCKEQAVETTLRDVARIIKEKGEAVAFAGAGIFVESGIPAFRGGQGSGKSTTPWSTPK